MPYKFGDRDRDEAEANRRNADRNQRYEDEVLSRRKTEKPFETNWWIVGAIVVVTFALALFVTRQTAIVPPVAPTPPAPPVNCWTFSCVPVAPPAN
jgi:hypothetical protein